MISNNITDTGLHQEVPIGPVINESKSQQYKTTTNKGKTKP